MSRRTRIATTMGLTSLVVLIVLATGLVAVEPGESVVVRRFGRVIDRPMGAGLHWVAPLGIDRIDRVRTDEVRRLRLGLAGIPGAAEAPGAGEFLSGDQNVLQAEVVVQYRVADPVAFVVGVDRREEVLAALGEASLSRALARRGIDDAMGGDRLAVAVEVAETLQDDSERLGLGLAILGVNLTEVRPPEEVRPDFAATQAARSEVDTRLREAQGLADRLLAASASEVGAILDRAHAAAERSVILARSRADRFRSLATEVNRARPMTVQRIYLDTIRTQWPRVGRTVVLAPDEPLDLSILGPVDEP
ncbi:protease modulator HflK [Tautonia marina]|uniref:protease modulator HflK n=1 Tax=Tautonia marina TaxID=2653855 RepID=UPI001260DF40|nr:protease modulator HflK [Tautonia marina]